MSSQYLYVADTAKGIYVAAVSDKGPLMQPYSVMYDAFMNRSATVTQAGWYEVAIKGGVAHVPASAPKRVAAYVAAHMGADARIRACKTARVILDTRLGKSARSTPIGLPGGPCHVIRNIEEENLAPRLRDELIEDIEKGKDLTNAQADKVYGRESFPLSLGIFTKLNLTSHGQYRMDLRGVTIPEVKQALDEFEKWYQARRTDPKIKPVDQNLLVDLSQGSPVRFDAKKLGLTLVFAADPRAKTLSLVSTWWTNTPNPPKPKPGECSIIPFLDNRNRAEARPAILGSIRKAMLREARIIVASLQVREIPNTMPSTLQSIDWMTNSKKWLAEAQKNILKEAGVKGKSGSIKLNRVGRDAEFYTLDFGKEFPKVFANAYNTENAYAPMMTFESSYGGRTAAASNPKDAYQTLVHHAQSVSLMVYAKQVVDLFVKTSGAVSTPYIHLTPDRSVSVSLKLALGGNPTGKLTSTLSPNKTPEWTFEWKGTEETSKDLDALLDMIDEEGDTLQPIFNNTAQLKKFVAVLSKRMGVPVVMVQGTHMTFGGKVSGIKGHALLFFKLIYDLSLDIWHFTPNSLEFFVDASVLEDPKSGSLAPWIGKATSVDEAKYMLMDIFGKSFPGDLNPRRVNVQKVGDEYGISAEGGSTFKSQNVDNVVDYVKDLIAFMGRLAT